jgi:peptidyl-dipeptidase A
MSVESPEILERVREELVPLFVRSNEAYWVASTSGTDEAAVSAAAAEFELRRWYGEPATRQEVTRALEACPEDQPVVRRQLELLQRECLRNALPTEVIEDLVQRAQDIQQRFINHRGTVAGAPATQNRILEILKKSTDESERLEAWRASKEIGALVDDDLRELARRRNEAAHELGFRDFYHMELSLQEIDESALLAIADQLEELTREPFAQEKEKLDGAIRTRLRLGDEAIRPHHYADPFFQELPAHDSSTALLDRQFESTDLTRLIGNYFKGIGLPVANILERSDLFEREGKDQHAYCIHVDRRDDVRVLCNLRSNERWAGTLLHELGHAVYDAYMPSELPFMLRAPAHIMATEAVAMFFGRLSRHSGWLRENCGTSDEDLVALDEPMRERRRQAMLIFARWTLVMIHFEREFYADPGRKDLNRLWWQIVGQIQMIEVPDDVESGAEWATKIHLAVAPVYYHNYLLGELFASQLHAMVRSEVASDLSGYTGEEALGRYLRDRVFAPGATMPWQALVAHATGGPLTPGFFLQEFVA